MTKNTSETHCDGPFCTCASLDKPENPADSPAQEPQATKANSRLASFTLFLLPVLLICMAAALAEGLLPDGVVYAWWLYNTLHVTLRLGIIYFIGLAAATPFIFAARQDENTPLFAGRNPLSRSLYGVATAVWGIASVAVIGTLLMVTAYGLPFAGLYWHHSEPGKLPPHSAPADICRQDGYFCHLTDTFDPDERQLEIYRTNTFTMERVFVDDGSSARPAGTNPASEVELDVPAAIEQSCRYPYLLTAGDGQWTPAAPQPPDEWVQVEGFDGQVRQKNLDDYVHPIPDTEWSVLTIYPGDSRRLNYLVKDGGTHWELITVLPFTGRISNTGTLPQDLPYIEVTEPDWQYSQWLPFEQGRSWYCIPYPTMDPHYMSEYQSPYGPQKD